MTWIKYIKRLPGIKIGVQDIWYTSEYIPKLKINQHSLLTRKVFSRHNLSARVFFFVSSRSSMSSRHLHLDLDHHSIWIITVGSSLLEHHCWIIITRSGSSRMLSPDSSCHRKFYKAIPFSCWMHIYRAIPFSYWMWHLHRASPFSY